ncbi:MAG: aspartate ammonia-lyase [Paracoccaceae bacterium]|nr:MAG: aspartate ammonia-lyase [Paracoccaceae bacterium]
MRTERDSLGAARLPRSALYGLGTLRGVWNFDVSGRKLGDEQALLRALARIKQAAAATNRDLGLLSADIADALIAACREVVDGRHRAQFVIDMFEGSGGTSINMNMNEVLANRALQILGHDPGSYRLIHPNDHVNLGQSTNDVLPAAIKLAAIETMQALLSGLDRLGQVLAQRASELDDVLRLGRTCLQDAQPMRLGQMLGGHAAAVTRLTAHLSDRCAELAVLPLGGTAIGTGLGAAPDFRSRVHHHLSAIAGHPVRPAGNPFDAMQHADGLARCSAEVRITAETLARLAGDLIILSSGPGGGLGEVRLPPVQPGSSIMPGKVNPVLPMMMQQIAFAVAGNDLAVSMAAAHGQLEINHFEPIIATRLIDSIVILSRGIRLFTGRCLAGLDADRDRSLANLLDSPALATVLVPMIGHAETARLVRSAAADGRRLIDLAADLGLIQPDAVLPLLRRCTEPPAPPIVNTPSRTCVGTDAIRGTDG